MKPKYVFLTDEELVNHKVLGNTEEAMKNICTWVSDGRSLMSLCDLWEMSYGKVMWWLNLDPQRRAHYDQATIDGEEAKLMRPIATLEAVANFDIRSLYDDNGKLKDPTQYDKHTAMAVSGIDVTDEYDKGEKISTSSKIKTNDKLKAIELLGKNYKLWTDKIEHGGSLDLATGLSAARTRATNTTPSGSDDDQEN